MPSCGTEQLLMDGSALVRAVLLLPIPDIDNLWGCYSRYCLMVTEALWDSVQGTSRNLK
jgi:hypothetical protein